MNTDRPYLVFVRVGKNSLHRTWLDENTPRTWDLQLSQYDDDPDIGIGGDLPLTVDKGTKWDSVYRYLIANPELFDKYKYMAFLDDDLELTTKDFNRFFEICEENDLYVAQPSLHPDSYCCYPILFQCPKMQLRYSNYVECMAPALKSEYLKEILPHMSEVVTGWGVDHIWTVLMDNPPFKSAIIDEISMVHTRPHTNSGGVYADFKEKNASPHAELKHIRSSYEGLWQRMIVYGGLNEKGAQTNGAIARYKNGMHLTLHATRVKDWKRSMKSGLGMLMRIITAHGYRPSQIKRIKVE